MPISLVLFDMDDVLVRYDRAGRVSCLASLSNRSVDEVVDAAGLHGVARRMVKGAL